MNLCALDRSTIAYVIYCDGAQKANIVVVVTHNIRHACNLNVPSCSNWYCEMSLFCVVVAM